MNKDDMFKQITDIDQMLSGFVTIGSIAANYYQSMIEGGMPEPLARELLRDWHRLFMWRQMWPDQPPSGEMFE